MASFNIDLWKTLKDKLEYDKNGRTLSVPMFFGLAPEKQATPYCVMHVLDCGNDEYAQTLCQNDEGYNAPGISDIQFNLYLTNDMAIDEMLQELNALIKKFKNLEEYRIISAVRKRTRNAASFTNETGMGLTEFEFKYEKL